MITRQSLILLFAIAFALLILGPPLLGQPFPGYPLMDWADVLDIATPLVLMPLYWVLFTDAGRVYRTLSLALAFAVLAAHGRKARKCISPPTPSAICSAEGPQKPTR